MSVRGPMAAAIERFALRRGLGPLPASFDAIRSDPEVGARIAAEYAALPTFDCAALPAYRAFVVELDAQYDYLVGELGVRIEFVDADPYPLAGDCPDIDALLADLTRWHLYVWRTAAGDNPHPVLSVAENDRFRAVHDAFGHGATGRGFDRHGEEAAWVAHSHLFSTLARRALTTETRGQNCGLIYGGGVFPPQKAACCQRGVRSFRTFPELS